jgi:hypothetical protein
MHGSETLVTVMCHNYRYPIANLSLNEDYCSWVTKYRSRHRLLPDDRCVVVLVVNWIQSGLRLGYGLGVTSLIQTAGGCTFRFAADASGPVLFPVQLC